MLKKFIYQARGHMLKRLLLSWLIGSFFFMLSGCGGASRKQPLELADSHRFVTSPAADFNRSLALPLSPQALTPRDYEIGPEDLLEITLFNIDPGDGLPSKVRVRVSQTGFITLPLLGRVRVRGLTRAQMEETLRNGYGEFMHKPDVGVMVAEGRSHSVSILGAVRNPGVFAITGPRRLRHLLAMAGGLTKEAGLYVHLSRQEPTGKDSYVINLHDLANDKGGQFNLVVRSGDFINVPFAGTFFIDGYVQRPNAYLLLRPYTLTQALALAGGLDTYAESSNITVFRRDAKGNVQSLKYDLANIRAMEAEDIRIAENDVIVVPPSTGKIVLSTLLGAVGFTSRASSFAWRFGGRGVQGFR
ncbi:MAG: polysaccharide export protein [Deltaproteobacteria bacterium]|nr:polysaccharide export protein [Deltaproteobacteria bacterium]